MSIARKAKPSPEQIAAIQALRREKREKKELERLATDASNTSNATLNKSSLLTRSWLTPLQSEVHEHLKCSSRVKILSWNLLAQCLVRRELFSTSDCLKVAQREFIIHDELLRQNADILCLQEVDRLEKLLPMLENAGYSHHYASGHGKKHGCLIAFKKALFSIVSQKVLYYDEQNVGIDLSTSRTGGSFKTKNIGNLVALRATTNGNEGLIVATTHLFWHPRYTYERTRQTAILFREIIAFRREILLDWPSVVAGDFNFTPSDPAYSLLSKDNLLEPQIEAITSSLVVHSSLDPSALKNSPLAARADGDDEAEDVDPDRVITNARFATAEDGLLTIPEIKEQFSKFPLIRSAYNDGLCSTKQDSNSSTYGKRVVLPPGRKGWYEPSYTSYTHYWKSVLDYIFLIDSSKRSVKVTGLLAPLEESDMAPGLPKKDVSGSDHTCLVAELSW